uniref:EIN3-binding F-box protein 1 n=1 Tax=Cacopsylla melanoneura TaxID=428564 RepID=A0A8D9F9L8_9HEMI
MELSTDEYKDESSYLPMEILSQIFDYLPHISLKNCRLVCKHWYNASLEHRFISNECIYLDHISYLSNKADILNLFVQSVRNYHHLVIQDCEINNSDPWFELFDKYATQIQSLCIDRCDISEKTFVSIIQTLRSLRKLEVHCCNQLLMSGLLFDNQPMSDLTLPHLNQLELVSNRYISDLLLHRFFSLTHCVRHVSLKNTNISFHRALYKRFYPTSEQNHDVELVPGQITTNPTSPASSSPRHYSETVLTFTHIVQFLAVNAATLHSLDLSLTLIDNESLAQLATLSELRLKHIRLVSCDQVSNEGFIQLFQNQPSLLHVDLSSCSRLTDLSILSLRTSCAHLTELRMRNCAGLTDIAVSGLGRCLLRLKYLDVSHCTQITGQGVSQLLHSTDPDTASTPTPCPQKDAKTRCTLHTLILSALNMSPALFHLVLPLCSQLRVLDLSYCFTTVTDETLRLMFEYCTRLTELSLLSCDAITDYGLIGLTKSEFEGTEPGYVSSDVLVNNIPQIKATVQNVCENNSLSKTSPKLFLGSKAERQIIQQSQDKKEVLELMRNVAEPCGALLRQGVEMKNMCGLNRVKGLTKLNLYGCGRISDASLIYGLSHCTFLQHLDLSEVHQLSSEGIRALCRNNYRIQRLKLHRCHNLRDEDIECIASKMKTLQSLDVAGCSLLSDKSLHSLILHCSCLQYLSIQKCPLITQSGINCLAASLSCLRTIVSSPQSEQRDATGATVPLPPPLHPMLNRAGAIRR